MMGGGACDLEDMGVLADGVMPRDVGPRVLQQLARRPCFPMYALLLNSARYADAVTGAAGPDPRLRPPLRWPGVYALYYTGYDHPLYGGLSGASEPLYIGKADNVAERLRQHAESLADVIDLNPGDFSARWLQFSPAHGDVKEWFERAAIRHVQPLWNVVLKGFGNKNQGAKRADRACSLFDVLHPGRRHVGRSAFLVASDRADTALAQILAEDCAAEAAALGKGCVLPSGAYRVDVSMDLGALSAARGERAAFMNVDTDLRLLVRRALALRGLLGPPPRAPATVMASAYTLAARYGIRTEASSAGGSADLAASSLPALTSPFCGGYGDFMIAF